MRREGDEHSREGDEHLSHGGGLCGRSREDTLKATFT